MSELDWMEREERYKSRMTRSLVITTLLTVVFFSTGYYLLGRKDKAHEKATAAATLAAAQAEAKRINDAYVADSTRAATRFTAFKEKYGAQPLDGAPVILVPLPRGTGVVRFLETTWPEYARVVDPEIDAQHITERLSTQFVDVMNRVTSTPSGTLAWQGDRQPTAILLPDIKQKGKDLEFERPSFPQIVRGQEAAGIRAIEVPDSLAARPPQGADVDVILTSAGSQKDRVVAVIREVTGIGEADALAIVDGAPAAVKEDVPKAVADEIKRRLEEVGGTVEVRP